ncbi:MAG TPA: hypothetical protein DCP38_10630 [Acidobacteria bacterium]|jgi:carbon-monoxide dehydrogenase medium subunit|nr:hypothetical protein [Acidobacteriota bacterium]HAK55920.1 hypothetical protein [Acidobacteriota bacterium]|tara:strand:- start:14218 stop:15117 length:900 start_codon:yes stop_codon:yes gene_type:complete
MRKTKTKTVTSTTYLRPTDLNDLQQIMAEHQGRAAVVAGATDMIPQMRAGRTLPAVLVDLCEIAELSFIREEHGSIAIGATTTMAKLASSPIIASGSPFLATAARQVGHPQTRNRATIGGNLANASPSADTAPPLLALGAAVQIMSPDGAIRDVPLHQFFHSYRVTDLGEGDVLTRITFPRPPDGAAGRFTKIGLRSASSISVASVAVMLEMEETTCRTARVAAGSVAPIPMRVFRVEELLEGHEIGETLVEECSELLRAEISPISDVRGSDKYRSYVASAVLKRQIEMAVADRRTFGA